MIKTRSFGKRTDAPSLLQQPAVALLPWGNVLEDFLDTIGVSLEDFCTEFRGSWMFGYVDALRQVGVRTVLICISARVSAPSRFIHGPTGATICVLPVPRSYRLIRSRMMNPYGRNVKQTFGDLGGVRAWLPLFAMSHEVALYLTTPLKLLARELRREGCSAVLCQEYEYPRFDACVLLGRLMGLPVFATFQGGNYQRNHIEGFLRPHAVRACAGLIIGTRSEARRVQARYGLAAEKITRIFNPIDVESWTPFDRNTARDALAIPHAAKVVVWHGRISIQQKGLDVLLDAWKKICSDRTSQDLRLLLVGTGKDAEKLRQRITSMHLTGILWIDRFVHERETVRRYLSAGDVYAFPSRHEGFSVAPIEAMACGRPVVAADAPGIPDILEGGEASGGLIVPQEDSNQLALAIGGLLDDERRARALGVSARRRAQAYFSLQAVGKQLRAVLLKGQQRDDEKITEPNLGSV